MNSPSIVGILLAAGQSTRFGSDKLLHTLKGGAASMIEQSATNLLQVLPNSVAVIPQGASMLRLCLENIGMPWVENEQAVSGMSSSLQCGMSYFARKDKLISAWLFALADMPYISPTTIKQIVGALERDALIAAPYYNGKRGHPVGFCRHFENELMALSGDRGGKNIIDRHQNELTRLEVNDESVICDIDYPHQIL